MNVQCVGRRVWAFTLWDLLGLVLMILGRFLALSSIGTSRINCSGNLRQIGLAARLWSVDHGDSFPWDVPRGEGGLKGGDQITNVYQYFLVMNNELVSPKVLKCPLDDVQARVASWAELSDASVSYALNVRAVSGEANSILSSDRTLSTNGVVRVGFMELPRSMNASWASGLHPDAGNVGFGDGSVRMVEQLQLRRVVRDQPESGGRMLMPQAPSPRLVAGSGSRRVWPPQIWAIAAFSGFLLCLSVFVARKKLE